MRVTPAWIALALALAGCASGRTQHERGWLGGRFADVDAAGILRPVPSLAADGSVVGVPQDVAQDGAALLIGAWPGTPAAAAGLAAGDLVVAVDGAPVTSSAALRAAFAAKAPGSTATVSFRRGAAAQTAEVAVGRETWERVGTIRLGLGLSSSFDLWPFDDGIDLLGLVRFRTGGAPPDLAGPEAAYLRDAFPGAPVEAPPGAGWDVFVLCLGGGAREHVTSQEAVAR